MPFIGGDQITPHDYIPAHTVEVGDQIAIDDDLIEVSVVVDEDSILVRGYSHTQGDDVTYILSPDTEVGLWTV